MCDLPALTFSARRSCLLRNRIIDIVRSHLKVQAQTNTNHHHFRLKYIFFLLVGVGPAMIFLHLPRSNATLLSIPISSKSLFTKSLQVFLGLPTFLFPNTSVSSTNRNTPPSVSLLTWPNHCNLFCLNLSCIYKRTWIWRKYYRVACIITWLVMAFCLGLFVIVLLNSVLSSN